MQEDRRSENTAHVPLDPSGLIVRYTDRTKGWGRAMDRIDRNIRQRQCQEQGQTDRD